MTDRRDPAAEGGFQGDVIGACEMAHARDYRRHLPAMLESPELDVDDPAFVSSSAAAIRSLGAGRLHRRTRFVTLQRGTCASSSAPTSATPR